MAHTVGVEEARGVGLRRSAVAAAPLLLAMGALLAIRDLGAHPAATVAALAAAVAAFIWSLRCVAATEVPAATVLLVAAVSRLLLLPLAPTLSDDVYRYVWDGQVAAAGWNPYYHAPQDPALAPWRDDNWERVAHRDVETVYPPLAIAAFGVASRFAHAVTAWKAMLIAIDLLSCGVLLRLARSRGVPSGRAIAYAWNPMVAIEVAGMGHVDALGVLALLLAALLLIEPGRDQGPIARRRSAAAGAALALGILAKLVPVLLVPAWTRAAPRRALFVAACVMVVVLACAPFALGASGAPPGLVTYAVSWEWNGPLFEPLWRALDRAGAVEIVKHVVAGLERAIGHRDFWARVDHYVYPQLLAKLVLAAALAVVVVRSVRQRDPVAAARRVFGGALVLSATVYPWYALWVLPWAALDWSVSWLVLSLSLLASYLPRLLDVPLLPWPFLAIWTPFAIALLLRRRGRPRSTAVEARPTA